MLANIYLQLIQCTKQLNRTMAVNADGPTHLAKKLCTSLLVYSLLFPLGTFHIKYSYFILYTPRVYRQGAIAIYIRAENIIYIRGASGK